MLTLIRTWMHRWNAERLRIIQLENGRVMGITAANAIRAVLVCAEHRKHKGQDAHDLFGVIGQVLDLWEQDTSTDAWMALLRTLERQGVLIPTGDFDHATGTQANRAGRWPGRNT